MTPNYDPKERPKNDVVPDWLLGGNRKRCVLGALAEPDEPRGWKPAELATALGCGRTTVFEIVRVLRPMQIIADDGSGHVRLDPKSTLGHALINLLPIINAFAELPVDRPPRGPARRA